MLLPQTPKGTGRESYDSGVIKIVEEMSFNTKDDLILIAKAYKGLIDLLITKTLIAEGDVTTDMNDLRNQI
jgi:hypothetical protein